MTLPPVVVTRDSTRPAPGCSPREVAEILLAFLDAFNRGDQQQLAHFFGDDFQWYSVTTRGPNGEQRGNYAAFSPTTLLDYFAKQHAQGERLYLRTVDVAGSWGRADIAYVLAHDAGDPVQDASGKGTLSCPDRRIVAWSMSIGAPIRMPCPAPPAGTPPSAVVACARAETPGTETPAATPVPGQP